QRLVLLVAVEGNHVGLLDEAIEGGRHSGEPCDVVVPPAPHLDFEVAQAIRADAVLEGLRAAVAQPGIRGDVSRGDGIEQSNAVADGEGLGRRRRGPALEVALLELAGYGARPELQEILAP